jgi:phage host-nuclease inhibitor protein Gam
MKKPSKQKTKAGPHAPQTRDECAKAIADLGRTARALARAEASMNEEIASVTEAYQPKIDELKAAIELQTEVIRVWCEAHRVELTSGNKVKFANLVTGNIEWRKATDSVIAPKDQAAVIALLEEKQLHRFIRVKKEVNKEAILADRDAIKGIPGLSIRIGKESFYVVPFEQEVQ